MVAVQFTESQQRHVTLILDRLVREARERLSAWERSSGSGREDSAVHNALVALIRETEQAGALLSLSFEERPADPRRELSAWSTAWWSTVLDARPSALRGYGEVDPETAELLAPMVQRLAERLLHLKLLTERGHG